MNNGAVEDSSRSLSLENKNNLDINLDNLEPEEDKMAKAIADAMADDESVSESDPESDESEPEFKLLEEEKKATLSLITKKISKLIFKGLFYSINELILAAHDIFKNHPEKPTRNKIYAAVIIVFIGIGIAFPFGILPQFGDFLTKIAGLISSNSGFAHFFTGWASGAFFSGIAAVITKLSIREYCYNNYGHREIILTDRHCDQISQNIGMPKEEILEYKTYFLKAIEMNGLPQISLNDCEKGYKLFIKGKTKGLWYAAMIKKSIMADEQKRNKYRKKLKDLKKIAKKVARKSSLNSSMNTSINPGSTPEKMHSGSISKEQEHQVFRDLIFSAALESRRTNEISPPNSPRFRVARIGDEIENDENKDGLITSPGIKIRDRYKYESENEDTYKIVYNALVKKYENRSQQPQSP